MSEFDEQLWRLRPRVQFEVWNGGHHIRDWPFQTQTPVRGDMIALPSGNYEVIRRVWDFTEPAVHRLQIDVQPIPPVGSTKRRGFDPPLVVVKEPA